MITEKQKQFISVVLYIRDNEEKIKSFLPVICGIMENNFECFEIICVDDDSVDKSVESIRSFVAGLEQRQIVTIVQMSSHQGLEMSMNAGVDLAIGDLIFEFDNIEGEYGESLIMDAYRKVTGGSDIVSVSPSKSGGLTSWAFYHIFNWGASSSLNPISHEDFRIVSRRALNRIKAVNQYIPFRKALYSQCGLPVTKITYKTKNRHHTMDPLDKRVNLALETLILFTTSIQKIALFISLLFALITVGVGIYLIYEFIGAGGTVEGWLTTMAFLTLGFLGMFLLFFIVFKYLSVVLNTIFIKQRYSVKSINKL